MMVKFFLIGSKQGRLRGIPNRLMLANNHAQRVDDSVIFEADVAVRQFEDFGGRITTFSPFGEDPLRLHSELLCRREAEFRERYPDFSHFFHAIVNSNNSLFRQGILFLIDLSKHLENTLN